MEPTGPADVFLLTSPLPNWKGEQECIAPGLQIRRLSAPELDALAASDPLELRAAPVDGFWVCYEFDNPHPSDNIRYRRRRDAAFKFFQQALYSLQILAPVGGCPALFLLRAGGDGLTLESVQQRYAFLPTVWSSLCPPPASFRKDIGPLLERVREVFRKPTLRLQIPIWLLEQGLAAPDRHIRILLWTTGLDGITGSGGTVAFADRMYELLGAETPVFPPDPLGRQPQFRVMDIVQDLYELRNEMAHGLPFHEKFRKKKPFLPPQDPPSPEGFEGYRYDHVLEECAIFLLCQTLKTILMRDRSTPLD